MRVHSGEGEEGVGDAFRRRQTRVFAGNGAGAQPGAHDAGIEQVGAHPGLADFAGVDLDEHVEPCLADRIGAPVGEDAARDPEVVDRDQGRLVQRIAEVCRWCLDAFG